jgi:hypothetical protein
MWSDSSSTSLLAGGAILCVSAIESALLPSNMTTAASHIKLFPTR